MAPLSTHPIPENIAGILEEKIKLRLSQDATRKSDKLNNVEFFALVDCTQTSYGFACYLFSSHSVYTSLNWLTTSLIIFVYSNKYLVDDYISYKQWARNQNTYA